QVPRSQAQGLRLPQVAGAARAVAGGHRRDPSDGRKPRAGDQRGGGGGVRVPPLRPLMNWFAPWPESASGARDAKRKAALAAGGPGPDYRSQGPALVRTNFNQLAARVPKLQEPLAGIEDRTLGGGVRIRLYRPDAKGPLPVLLYFHGGGWVV